MTCVEHFTLRQYGLYLEYTIHYNGSLESSFGNLLDLRDCDLRTTSSSFLHIQVPDRVEWPSNHPHEYHIWTSRRWSVTIEPVRYRQSTTSMCLWSLRSDGVCCVVHRMMICVSIILGAGWVSRSGSVVSRKKKRRQVSTQTIILLSSPSMRNGTAQECRCMGRLWVFTYRLCQLKRLECIETITMLSKIEYTSFLWVVVL